VIIPREEPKTYNWPEYECGLKMEAVEAMKCLESNKNESEIMPLSFSSLLMKTLNAIREKAGVLYPGRDK
jgi:hypothetical protein